MICIGKKLVNDELKIYRGNDFVVSKYIHVHQPSLSEICNYGEREYYSMIYQLTATPQSMKVQLWDMGIDYTKITPYELFYSILFKLYSQEKTSIIFGNLDLTKFHLIQNQDDGTFFLYQRIEKSSCNANNIKKNSILSKIITKFKTVFKISDKKTTTEYDEIVIDESSYNVIMDYLRQSHGIHIDEKIPGNESTKMILIEDDREEMERNKNKDYHSQLKNLISAMINCEGFKYNHNDVWDMKIGAFMDSVKRVTKIKNANLLLQSGCSGFGVNLKEISNKQLDWMGELE